MNDLTDKNEFYKLVEQIIIIKGEDWFNEWSLSNPITNFQESLSDEELNDMILDPTCCHISTINYKSMSKKLKSDSRGN